MTEGLTKWIEAKPVKEATAGVAAKFLMNEIIQRYGVPLTVITDNGSHFRGEFHDLCQKMGILHRYGTPYHPQTTGLDERTNGLLLGRIRKWQRDGYTKWDEDMPASVFTCNTRKISTSNFSAMESLMGYTAGTASGLKYAKMSKGEVKERIKLVKGIIPDDVTRERLRGLETLRDEAIRIKALKSLEMKRRYDKKVRENNFEVGDEVLLYNSSLKKQWSRKLEEQWLGPYLVTWKGTLGAYAIEINGKKRVVSGDNLKRYFRRE
jgi:transposase InsO family protein